MSHGTSMNHITHVNEWVIAHKNESCRECQWNSDTTHMDESNHAYEWVMSHMSMKKSDGVATTCKLLKIIGLFCRISSLLNGSFAKETYNFKEPTNRSRPIIRCISCTLCIPLRIGAQFVYIYEYISYTYTRQQFYRVAKTHRIPYLYGSFSAKVTYI